MKLRSDSIQIFSFAMVFFVLVSILVPLITGMRHSQGINERWQKAKTHWHFALSSAVNGAEIEDEAIAFLTAPLESENFQTLVLFFRPLETLKESLLYRLHRLSPSYFLKSILELELELDRLTEELNILSSQQGSSFETLLILSYLLIALLLMLYGVQSRQLAIARRECRLFQEKFGLEVSVGGNTSFRPSWNMDSGFVELAIHDDGRGMGDSKPGFGIHGMKERAALLGGSIEWKSLPAKGTEIHLSVPEVLS